ncbi:MAG: PorT family protein [Mucilaginibacter polytrichastri]|nr:PorT family protein [Mucilaginibacter polytrichastri]
MKTAYPLFFSLLITVFTHAAYAQSNPKSATVNYIGGVVKKGVIDYRNWQSSPSVVSFRADGSSRLEKLDTASVLSFEINDNDLHLRFENHAVPVEVTPRTLNDVFEKAMPDYARRHVFLRVLRKGRSTLYSANFGQKDVFYLSVNGSEPFELISRRFQNKNQIIRDDRFHEQLRDSSGGCIDSTSAFAAAYSAKQLSAVLQKCEDRKPAFEQQLAAQKHRFGVVAGLNASRVKYFEPPGYVTNVPPEIDIPAKPALHAGLFGELSVSRNVRKFSGYIEAAYTQFRASGPAILKDQQVYDYRMQYDFVKFSVMPRYYLPRPSLFINAGVSNNILLSYSQTYSRSGETRDVGGVYTDLRKFNQSVIGGVGYIWKNLSAEVRFEMSSGRSTYQHRSNTFRTFYGLLSYGF